MSNLFNRYFEYSRVVSVQIVTEDGIYKKGEVPEEYGGSELEVEVVHALTMSMSTGEMVIFELEVVEAKDRDGNIGGPIKRDGVEIKPGSGAATVQVTRINGNMSQEHTALAAWTKAQVDAEATANAQVKT